MSCQAALLITSIVVCASYALLERGAMRFTSAKATPDCAESRVCTETPATSRAYLWAIVKLAFMPLAFKRAVRLTLCVPGI